MNSLFDFAVRITLSVDRIIIGEKITNATKAKPSFREYACLISITRLETKTALAPMIAAPKCFLSKVSVPQVKPTINIMTLIARTFE